MDLKNGFFLNRDQGLHKRSLHGGGGEGGNRRTRKKTFDLRAGVKKGLSPLSSRNVRIFEMDFLIECERIPLKASRPSIHHHRHRHRGSLKWNEDCTQGSADEEEPFFFFFFFLVEWGLLRMRLTDLHAASSLPAQKLIVVPLRVIFFFVFLFFFF